MRAKLLILESPGKVKKVQEILGPGWKVAASVGHVRDLPVKEMGVAAPDFKPQYIPTDRGKDVLSRLWTGSGRYLRQRAALCFRKAGKFWPIRKMARTKETQKMRKSLVIPSRP